jgi:hypothetical protein
MGNEKVDPSNFHLGMQVGEIKAWCEAAKSGAKAMSLSVPFKPKDYERLSRHMEEQASRNGVKFYLERDLIRTDLFADLDLSGMLVFIIYRDDQVLADYLNLKSEKVCLVDNGEYTDEARRDVALRFARLLGYEEGYASSKLASGQA